MKRINRAQDIQITNRSTGIVVIPLAIGGTMVLKEGASNYITVNDLLQIKAKTEFVINAGLISIDTFDGDDMNTEDIAKLLNVSIDKIVSPIDKILELSMTNQKGNIAKFKTIIESLDGFAEKNVLTVLMDKDKATGIENAHVLRYLRENFEVWKLYEDRITDDLKFEELQAEQSKN